MKVGIYFPVFPKEAGGGHAFEQEILLALQKLVGECRHELVLFFGESGSTPVAGFRSVAVEAPQSKLPMKIFNRVKRELDMGGPQNISALQRAAQQEKIEFIWFATPMYMPVDIPYVATVWDIQHRLQPWFPEVSKAGEWESREAYYSVYLKRAAYILTPNRTGQNELALFYQLLPERFRLLPHPAPRIERIPNPDEVRQVREKYHLAGNYLIYPAQFWAHKNHANLLLALKMLPSIQLVLIGSNQGNLDHVRGMANELGLGDRVHFPGFIPREDLIALYCGALALTYVSLFGPENLPPLEAFQCRCPVIVSDYSGAREQLGDAALFVNGLKPDEIASAVLQLSKNEALRHGLIEKGYQRAMVYSGEDYVRDVFKIFDEFEPIRKSWGTGS